ncbi:ABC transporter permease [Trinickia sp. Y13]|uniref:ABC transporter permease n=1 Tax=Trinickia sp. Y13 TaxID=2917807 RepID=UPI0024068C5B|nr:ABC transporter permease [Trinickia sp. Y13]MDG0025572.1 ABC transporter permease [Trinickia sp. Y13]
MANFRPRNTTPKRSVPVSWEALLTVILLGSFAFGRLLSPVFVNADNLGNILLDITEISLMALPMTLIIVMGEIDLSVASVLGASSALMGALWHAGLPMPAVMALVIAGGAAAGLLNGWLVVRLELPSLAVTIGTLALFRGLAYVLLGDQAVADFPASYTAFGMDTLGATLIPLPFVIVIAGAALFSVVLHATPFGRSLYAIGANASAARFSGIDVRKIKLRLFVLSGLVSAIAGIIFTLRFTSARGDNGEGFELAVIAAVLFGGVSIFGGRGSLYGVLLSLLIVGVLRNALTLVDVSSETLTIVTGLLLLSSVLIPNLAAGWRARKDKLSVVAAKR